MKVILKKDIANLGIEGEIKEVKDGYGRNYLIPRGFVDLATPGAIRAWKQSETKRKKKMEAEIKRLGVEAGKISEITLTFSRKISEEGVMFGSVAKSDIIKGLKAAGIEVQKDMLRMESSIKVVGESKIKVSLRQDIDAELKIVITAQSK